jgi:non-ribosomal peptide synthetase component F
VNDKPERINAAALLLARGRPLQPALACPDRSVSYGELRKLVARAATVWLESGVGPGEVLMLRSDHGLQHVVAFLGAIWAGAVPVPLRSALGPEGADVQRGLVHYQLQGPDAVHAHVHSGLPWHAWNADLHDVPPTAAVPCLPEDPACWADPRSWSEGRARVLPHRFALGLVAQPGTLALAQAGSMLAVLRALRRGVTAVLHPGETEAALPHAA